MCWPSHEHIPLLCLLGFLGLLSGDLLLREPTHSAFSHIRVRGIQL
jgi:hypothetical protein